jgi:uncharacterized membrane protein
MYRLAFERLHRFFQNHHFYALVLASMLTFLLFSARVWRVQQITYVFMIWNLFLAWVPYAASIWAASINERKPDARWRLLIPGFLWLLFFPNAPYLVTDLIHLRDRPPVPMWYDGALLATFVLNGCFLAVVSLHTMQRLVQRLAGSLASWCFAAISLVLAGIGVYLGRVQRWNSWDILFSPHHILIDVIMLIRFPLDNVHRIALSGVSIIVVTICYILFLSASYAGTLRTKEAVIN